jgi:Ni/Co efflux regulator RcnB
MKRLLTAALALSLLGGTAAMAQPYGHGDDRGDHRYERGHDRGHHYGERRHWARGQRLPVTYYRDHRYWVDYRAHHLRAPPRGYRWVHVDNDYLLVAATTGLIAQIIANQ